MTHEEEIMLAYRNLEKAISEYCRALRDPEIRNNIFVHEYVLAVSIESMEPGKSGYTYFTFTAPQNSPKYSIRGLLDEASNWYRSGTRRIDD